MYELMDFIDFFIIFGNTGLFTKSHVGFQFCQILAGYAIEEKELSFGTFQKKDIDAIKTDLKGNPFKSFVYYILYTL